jgi:hypothetical protein
MGPITSVMAEELTRALSIRPQLAVFLHEKHPRTSDPLGKPREMMEPDSLGG